jgi:hypothetical protein
VSGCSLSGDYLAAICPQATTVNRCLTPDDRAFSFLSKDEINVEDALTRVLALATGAVSAEGVSEQHATHSPHYAAAVGKHAAMLRAIALVLRMRCMAPVLLW